MTVSRLPYRSSDLINDPFLSFSASSSAPSFATNFLSSSSFCDAEPSLLVPLLFDIYIKTSATLGTEALTKAFHHRRLTRSLIFEEEKVEAAEACNRKTRSRRSFEEKHVAAE